MCMASTENSIICKDRVASKIVVVSNFMMLVSISMERRRGTTYFTYFKCGPPLHS